VVKNIFLKNQAFGNSPYYHVMAHCITILSFFQGNKSATGPTTEKYNLKYPASYIRITHDE
jgi:hypothetical protein